MIRIVYTAVFVMLETFDSVDTPCCYGGVRGKVQIYMINLNTGMRTPPRCSAMAWSTAAEPPNVV